MSNHKEHAVHPLGMQNPWLIGGKVLFQKTWKDMPNAGWDDPLEETLQKDVESWWKKTEAKTLYFPRALSRDGLRPATSFG